MNELAQAGGIGPVGYSALEPGGREGALGAKPFGGLEIGRQQVPAGTAKIAGQGPDRLDAGLTDGQARDVGEGSLADSAIGRKQGAI